MTEIDGQGAFFTQQFIHSGEAPDIMACVGSVVLTQAVVDVDPRSVRMRSALSEELIALTKLAYAYTTLPGVKAFMQVKTVSVGTNVNCARGVALTLLSVYHEYTTVA